MRTEIRPTEDQEAFIRHAIAAGRIERAELLSDLDDAEAALSRGEGMIITKPSMQAPAEAVMQRGRVRMAVEKTAL